ncbi:MAG: type III-A CRISPR-associated CARF protein Csm6 [Faecousia sp.]
MASILYSCFGTTDPVRGMRDGGLMHILRFYRPEAVYLFLSKEIVELDRADRRITKTFAYLRENWGGYQPDVIRAETGIEDPSDMDALTEPMDALLQQAMRDHPKTEVLINLSSGTPQMQIILTQMALDPRYPTKGIQIKNPERASGRAERTNGKQYPVDEALGLNEDEAPDTPNRCCEPRLTAVRREAVRNQLRSLLSQRNYAAIAQMGADLPAPIPKLARHLDYRSRFLLKEAEAEAAGLGGLGLQVGRGGYPYPIYELIEYFAMLKNLVQLKRYTDFMLRLNPFVVRLQTVLLEEALKPLGLTERELLPVVNGRKKLRPELLRNKLPALLPFMEAAFGCTLEERDISIRAMNVMLNYLQADRTVLELLESCERGNRELRNPAAHDLFAVTNEDIRNICGADAEGLIRGLEKVLTDTLAHYGDKGLTKRINLYDHCDRIIRECL